MAGTSAARVEANRLNARKSTGPKSAEGKARSRANAVKHGLTGAGVALTTEDAATVEDRFARLREQMAPRSSMGVVLVGKIALMSVRMERAARHEAAALSTKIRRASLDFDLDRQAEVDRLFDAIATNPRDNHRRLLTSPEGVTRLSQALRGAKAQLQKGLHRHWDEATSKRVEAFFGGSGDPFLMSRTHALLEALAGRPDWLEAEEVDHSEDPIVPEEWVVGQLIGEIDEELAVLETIQADFDLEAIEQDRLEAGDRALFDPGPDADRARKYEAAATRDFYRAIREFRQDQAEHDESDADALDWTPVDDPTQPSGSDAEAVEDLDEAGVPDEVNFRGADCRPASQAPTCQNEPNRDSVGARPFSQNEPILLQPPVPKQPVQPQPDGSRILNYHF